MRGDVKDDYDSLDFTKRQEEGCASSRDLIYSSKEGYQSVTLRGAKWLCSVGAKGMRKNLGKRGWKGELDSGIRKGFVYSVTECKPYPVTSREPLKNFKQEVGMVRFDFKILGAVFRKRKNKGEKGQDSAWSL